jgi:small subunit ribosomal protein S1
MVLKAFVPTKHLVKEDGKSLKAEEAAEFKIIEFNKENKRIVISHSRIWEEARADARVQDLKTVKKKQNLLTTRLRK